MSPVLGIDLGGTRLRAAWSSQPGDAPRALGEEPAPRSAGDLGARVAAYARQLPQPPTAIGLTIPGLVDGTVCRWVPNLPYLDGVDLANLLKPVFADPPTQHGHVVAGNDAQLALLAEAADGAASGTRDAILVAVGTGIGSAVLSQGRIARGAHGGACSFGWACADLSDPGDERLGWLERNASGTALDAAGATLDPPRDGAGLIAAARAGDAAALRALEPAVAALGATLAGAVALLDPEVVLLAGGVAAATDVLEPLLREQLAPRLPRHLRAVPVRAGAHGPRAGIAGALIAAHRGPTWWELHR
ncbi:ROK family protein [Conexibacter sp. JD483]|uniref:ROK family protein n=1 Tax=unclassified Conexibacter TaxID=2627773 RepID=UPI00271AB002|nr:MULTISPECIES: ROK family protein [unclassified Conexibacter]MDO8188406.1 ROK family protein [Conexibacter sp. CPCC 205706]MDO8198193.1 ROK family protein [Conexibacter sp. CPCC 205762]MDR9370671.1 ROK family protein [Conexibacter sp. JD483]